MNFVPQWAPVFVSFPEHSKPPFLGGGLVQSLLARNVPRSLLQLHMPQAAQVPLTESQRIQRPKVGLQ